MCQILKIAHKVPVRDVFDAIHPYAVDSALVPIPIPSDLKNAGLYPEPHQTGSPKHIVGIRCRSPSEDIRAALLCRARHLSVLWEDLAVFREVAGVAGVVASGWELETSDTAPWPCAKIETSARLQGLQPRLGHGEPTVTRSSHQSPVTSH